MTSAAGRFAPGATAIRRDVHAGRVWTAMPQRVLADVGDVLTLAYWPGITSLAPTTWITSLRIGDDAVRKRGLDELAAGSWGLGHYTWERTELLSHFLTGEHFSVHAFQDAATGEPIKWYVNFELPYARTLIGIDTFDLLLDLVAAPDLSSWSWKDEDEYAHGRRLGLFDDALHAAVEAARERALGMLQDRSGPFAAGWLTWSPSPSWPLPVLPAAADAMDTAS